MLLLPVSKVQESIYFRYVKGELNRALSLDVIGGLYNLRMSDIRKPDMNGLQLFDSVKEINRNVRVIFVKALDIAQN
jgi:DNA-binding NtrC family response regulator